MNNFRPNPFQPFHFNDGEFNALNFVVPNTYSQIDRHQHGPEDLEMFFQGASLHAALHKVRAIHNVGEEFYSRLYHNRFQIC